MKHSSKILDDRSVLKTDKAITWIHVRSKDDKKNANTRRRLLENNQISKKNIIIIIKKILSKVSLWSIITDDMEFLVKFAFLNIFE